jgi:predicted metal-binding membrane protein
MMRGTSMVSMAPPLSALISMWWLMMFAMMLPSATPAILLYARVREARGADPTVVPPWVFFGGYLLVWLLFSIAAAVIQSLVTDSSVALRNQRATAAVLVAAGLYQLSPMKSACLSQCRSPGQFISRHWRSGRYGALRLGVMHGAYCVGCCWMLMSLLFAGGVMNLLWVIGLTVLVASEKLLPRGQALQRFYGVGLVFWGVGEALA